MRIVVSGGGTAGHVSPVLATVDALRQRDKNLTILYLGQASGMEAALARAGGIKFAPINAGKVRRMPNEGIIQNLMDVRTQLLNIRDLGRTVQGLSQSISALRSFKPDVVFVKGGFVALPVALAARLLRIPYVAHESDITPGWGTRLIASGAASVATGFPSELYPSLPKSKLRFTGNPVRPEILKGDAARGRKTFDLSSRKPVVLIVGGSQGAVALNLAVLSGLKELLNTVQVIHVTGRNNLQDVRRESGLRGIKGSAAYRTADLLDATRMADAYAVADVVVARAGANTIAELAATKKPVILVPNQGAAAHQVINARRLEEAGAAVMVHDDQPERLNESILKLIGDEKKRTKLSQAISDFYVPDSPGQLADLILSNARSAE